MVGNLTELKPLEEPLNLLTALLQQNNRRLQAFCYFSAFELDTPQITRTSLLLPA